MTDYYDRGETYTVEMKVYNDDVLADADTATYEITDPNGVVQASGSLSKVETGVYRASYDIPSDATTGTWTVKCTATLGGKISIEKRTFIVR